MRKWLIALAALFCFAGGMRAQQFTTVTSTVVDSAGTPYISGTYSVSLVNTTGQQPLLGGNANFQQNFNGALTSAGFLSVSLPSVTQLFPLGMQWTFNICANPQVVAFQFPTLTVPCFSYTSTGTQISGTSVDLSSSMTPVATVIPKTPTTTGNNVFTGSLTVSGTQTNTGALNCTIINAVPCVDTANHAGWTGADACAWINSAQSAATGLNGANGTVDARGLTGSITCAGTLAIGSTTQGVTLLLGGVKLFVQNTVTIAQASRILGSGNSSGSVGTNPTWIAAGASFPTSGVYLVTAGPASGVADAISVRDAFLDCAGITGCKGMVAQNVQENSDFTNLTIVHNLGNGFDITGSSEDFKVQGVNIVAGAAATADNCFTLGTAANHIVFDTIGCTGQYASTPSTGAGIVCTGCNMEVIGFHSEAHADAIQLVGASPNHGYVTVNGVNTANNANGVGMTSVTHIQSTWGGTLRVSGSRLGVATNNIKNDVSGFTNVCTDAVLNKYDMGWGTGNPNAIQVDTDCSTLPTIRSATFAISGTTAGNFTPDATALMDLRGPSATFNGIRITDITSGNSYYFGPGAGTTLFGIRDITNNKNVAFFSNTAFGPQVAAGVTLGTAALPFSTLNLGTAATNNFTFTPAATAAARTVNIPDPTTTTTLGLSYNTTLGYTVAKRGTAGCTTAASIGGVCATPVTVTWPVTLPNANYSVVCQGAGAITNFPIMGSVTARNTTTATVQTMALTAAAASFATIDCIAIMD